MHFPYYIPEYGVEDLHCMFWVGRKCWEGKLRDITWGIHIDEDYVGMEALNSEETVSSLAFISSNTWLVSRVDAIQA